MEIDAAMMGEEEGVWRARKKRWESSVHVCFSHSTCLKAIKKKLPHHGKSSSSQSVPFIHNRLKISCTYQSRHRARQEMWFFSPSKTNFSWKPLSFGSFGWRGHNALLKYISDNGRRPVIGNPETFGNKNRACRRELGTIRREAS